MALAIQIVEILWTKATRGAPRSNERAGLPRAFALREPIADGWIETVRIVEWEEFRPARIAHRGIGSPDISEGCLHLRMRSANALEIAFLGTPMSGQPKRRPIQDFMRLASDTFGQVIVNARHTG